MINIKNINLHEEKKLLNEVANLHKRYFQKTIATTLSNKDLSKLYFYLLKNEIVSLFIALDKNKVVGSMSYKEKIDLKKTKIFDIILITILLFKGFIKHPLTWIVELTFKFNLYKNYPKETEIILIFVDQNYRGQNIGENLLKKLQSKNKNICVDTRKNNLNAIKFYKKNGFVEINKNRKNISLEFTSNSVSNA